jgi:hypothetical protein
MNRAASIKREAQKKFAELARKYKTPEQVQLFLRKIPYNNEEKGETIHSAYETLRYGKAHCFEAVFVAGAILEQRGFPPLVISFESRDRLGHTVFIFKQKGKWGAIARSREEGLNGRKPVFRSVRDLVWSYYNPYIDDTSEITEYRVVNLDDTKTDWRTSIKNVWQAEKYLVGLKHIPLGASAIRYKKTWNNYKKYGHPPKENYWW